jgi:ParB family transcriptional regulator, chromosome partitioning protein
MATKKRPVTKSGRPRKRKGVRIEPTELGPKELRLADPPAEVAELARQVEEDGGAVLAVYREPLGGHALLFAALPIDKVERTTFQRDVSDAHVRKLTLAMDKTRRYLDPIIAVREDGKYLSPNGGHRLTALQELGARAVLALVVPEKRVAYQILALNIEKAHNLREKSLEVVRMYRDLARLEDAKESDLGLELEEPALATLGFAYEKRGRLSGGAYQPILKKVDAFLDEKLSTAMAERERRADVLLAFDDAVSEAVAKLKERGFESPYLKAFVVARVNPLRFMKGAAPPFDELFEQMTKRARGMDPGKVKSADLARSGGAPAEAEG